MGMTPLAAPGSLVEMLTESRTCCFDMPHPHQLNFVGNSSVVELFEKSSIISVDQGFLGIKQ